MNKKYHLSIEAKAAQGVAHIQLVDRISEYSETSANSIREMIQGFTSKGITTAELYINSRGGNVFEAAEIANELKAKFNEVTITVGAVAASAVTRIMVEFEKVKAYPNSQFMIHKPKMGTYGDVDQVEADKKMLQNATDDYRSAYAKKFGKTEDEIDALWGKGDYWMNAKEALSIGLISEIMQEKQNVTAEDVAVLEACGAPTIPKIKTETKIEMDINQMRSVLGLDATATEQEVLAAAKTAKEKADQAEALQAQATANAKANAESLVDGAIKAKKIGAEQRAHWVALATANYDSTKASLEALQSVPKLSGELKDGEGSGNENRDNWNLDAWLEKDPEGLDALADTDPEKFKKINQL